MPAKKVVRTIILRLLNDKRLGVPILFWERLLWLKRRYKFDFEKTFQAHFKEREKFHFIQIGANDGISFDGLFSKVVNRASKGLVIEPSPVYFNKLVKNYEHLPHITPINKAIHNEESHITIYELNESGLDKLPDWGAGLGSMNKDHLLRFGVHEKDLHAHHVACISFNDLLREFSDFKDIDYLQIDTEGYDGQIIQSIDFDNFRVKIIKYESVNLSEDVSSRLELIFKRNKFRLFSFGIDRIAVRNDLHPQFS